MRLLATALVLALAPMMALTDDKKAPEQEVPVTGHADPRLESVDKLMTKFVAEHKMPGTAVAIARNGRVVYARGFGYSDREAKIPVEPGSLFRIASISKPVTAAAVLQLVDRGKLKLDENIFDVLNLTEPKGSDVEFDARWKKITIEHLLHHTAGWNRDKAFDPMFISPKVVKQLNVPAPATPDAIIRYMLGQPLQSDPGKEYSYSNFGYCLLGRVIEKRSGKPYEKYVQDNVLHPVGAQHMRLGHTLLSQRAKGEVLYYTKNNDTGRAIMGPRLGERVPQPYGAWCIESMDAHGGWIASAPDLARFAAAFEDPSACKILSKAMASHMFAPPAAPVSRKDDGSPKARYYGCGWEIVSMGKGKFNYFHTGSLDGTSTILVHRNDGFSWAVLFNTRTGKPNPSSAIDPLMHEAVDAVKEWPKGE